MWSVTEGALPSGLSLNPETGEISGTPDADGTSGFTVRVEDSLETRTETPILSKLPFS